MDIEKALKTIGDWTSRETELRKYPKGELLELSESLQELRSEIARQSATSEDVQEAISWAQGMEILYEEKQMPECADCAKTAIAALQEYQPTISKTETTKPTTLADKVKAMAHCAIDAGIIDAVDWSAEIIRRLEGTI